jgi:hypothetical protein
MTGSVPSGFDLAAQAREQFDEEEIVVRVLKTPHFVRRGRVVSAAFRPRRGSALLSVIRWLDREAPDRAVKARCKQIGAGGSGNVYSGVASLKARSCSSAGVALEYAPAEYPGHSHIRFPFAIPADEPLEGQRFVEAERIANILCEEAIHHADPDPESDEWTIPSEELPLTRRSDEGEVVSAGAT